MGRGEGEEEEGEGDGGREGVVCVNLKLLVEIAVTCGLM